MHRERVTVADFESDHFQAQLVERISWAVGDADQVERDVRPTARRASVPVPELEAQPVWAP